MKIEELILQSEKPFFSLEFFPPGEDSQLGAFYDTARELADLKPLFVSVTYGAGGKKRDRTLKVTSELVRMGLTVMAHLTCVGATPSFLSSYVTDLLAHGINNILALRGDAPLEGEWDPEKSYFRNAADLVKFLKKNFPNMGVGVAAYPSPHPESATFSEDRAWTAQKIREGAGFAITQLFFDVREYIDLVDNLRKAGILAPIIPGIFTIQSFESLKRVLSLCGVNIPAKLYLRLEAANEKGGAAAVREEGMLFALTMIRQLLDFGVPGIHLYTLNKSALCKTIVQEAGLA